MEPKKIMDADKHLPPKKRGGTFKQLLAAVAIVIIVGFAWKFIYKLVTKDDEDFTINGYEMHYYPKQVTLAEAQRLRDFVDSMDYPPTEWRLGKDSGRYIVEMSPTYGSYSYSWLERNGIARNISDGVFGGAKVELVRTNGLYGDDTYKDAMKQH